MQTQLHIDFLFHDSRKYLHYVYIPYYLTPWRGLRAAPRSMLIFPTRWIQTRLSPFCRRHLSAGDNRILGRSYASLSKLGLIVMRLAGDRVLLQVKGRDPFMTKELREDGKTNLQQ